MEQTFIVEKDWSNKLVLKEYSGDEEIVVIPANVYEIEPMVFEGHTEIKKVIFPEGLNTIGWEAFEGCSSLEEIVLPSTIRYVLNRAFSGCVSLSKVELPDTWEDHGFSLFGDETFKNCTALKEFIFPEAYDVLPGNMFEGCTSLSKVIMKNRTGKIYGKDERDLCSPLKKIALPGQLQTPALKRELMALAAKNILSEECDDEYKAEWIRYIKSQRKPCFELIQKDKYLSELALKEKILKPEELNARPINEEKISYDVSYEEARRKYTFTKRKNGFSINDFNKDGRIHGPMGDDYHYEFDDWKEIASKVVLIPNTIDGKPVGHVAVKTLPFDAIVLCDAVTFAKLDRRVKASTAVAYLEDESQFKKDEEAKIIEFIKKNPLDVARVLVNSNVPKAFSTYVKLGKPGKAALDVMIDSLRSNKEILAILLDASGQKQENIDLDFDSAKNVSVSDLKKEWAYEKKNIEIQGEYVTGIYLKKYKGINPDVQVPETIGKVKVLAVGQRCFENCNILESIMIPSSVQLIDTEAFANCENLRKVAITGEDVKVGRMAFKDCVSLEEVDLNDLSVKFDIHPFLGCEGLYDNNGLLSIDSVLVDSKCPIDMKELTVPEGITRIGDYAFAKFSESFGVSIWNNELRSIILPSTIKEIGTSAFYGCKVLQNVSIPEGLEKIGNWSFEECDSLREIHIPQSVAEIGDSIFEDKVVIYGFPGSQVEKYAENNGLVFVTEDEKSKAKNLVVDFVVDDGVLVKYLGKETDVVIPPEVKIISFNAFELNKDIKSVRIPAGVTEIEDFVFSDSTLETIEMSAGIKRIGSSVFSFCRNLKKVVLPEGLKSIGDNAFIYTGIEEITIPSSVEKIGKGAFVGCDKLKTIRNLSDVEIKDS